MGIVLRQSLKGSIVTYLGTAIGTFNVIFLYNKFLTKAEVGLIAGALVSIPLLFASFSQLGIPHIVVRYFPYFEDKNQKHNGFLPFILIAPLVGFSLFVSSYLLFRPIFFTFYQENSPLLSNYFYYIIPLTASFLYMSVLESYAKVHLRIVVPAIIRELYLRIINALLITAYALDFLNFDELILSITISYLGAVIGLLIYIKALKKLYLKPDFSFIKKPIFKEMCGYGFWVILAGASFTLIQHIEKILLPGYSGGLETTAIFDINSRIALMISIPRNVIASISSPILAQFWKQKDYKKIEDIYQKSSTNLLFIGCFLFLLIWCNLDLIYQIIPNKDAYITGKWVVLMVGISKIIDMGTGLNSELLLNSKYYRFDLFFFILLAFILIIGNIIFIPIYSFNGAAFASLVSLIIYNFIKFIFVWKKLNLQPFNKKTIIIIILSLAVYLIVNQIPLIKGDDLIKWILNIILRSTLISSLFLIGIYHFELLPEATAIIKKWLKK